MSSLQLAIPDVQNIHGRTAHLMSIRNHLVQLFSCTALLLEVALSHRAQSDGDEPKCWFQLRLRRGNSTARPHWVPSSVRASAGYEWYRLCIVQRTIHLNVASHAEFDVSCTLRDHNQRTCVHTEMYTASHRVTDNVFQMTYITDTCRFVLMWQVYQRNMDWRVMNLIWGELVNASTVACQCRHVFRACLRRTHFLFRINAPSGQAKARPPSRSSEELCWYFDVEGDGRQHAQAPSIVPC